MAAASTNNSASRPMVPRGVTLSGGAVWCGATGLPVCASATGCCPADRKSIAQPAIGAPVHSAFGSRCEFRCACPPRTKVGGCVREHESILRKGGARRAIAAARRRMTSAFFVEARASSAEPRDARRPRSETPHPHHLRAAPSAPRPASGSCARSASPPVDSSGPPCTDSGAAIARRGPATTAGRAAFVQLVAAVVEVFVEVVPAAGARRTTRPGT